MRRGPPTVLSTCRYIPRPAFQRARSRCCPKGRNEDVGARWRPGRGWRLSLVLGARHRYGAPRANGEDHPKAVRDLATQRCLNEPNEFNRRRLTAARRAAGASPSTAAPQSGFWTKGQSGFWTRTSSRFSREAYATRQVTARSGYRWCADCSACDNVIHREVTRFPDRTHK